MERGKSECTVIIIVSWLLSSNILNSVLDQDNLRPFSSDVAPMTTLRRFPGSKNYSLHHTAHRDIGPSLLGLRMLLVFSVSMISAISMKLSLSLPQNWAKFRGEFQSIETLCSFPADLSCLPYLIVSGLEPGLQPTSSNSELFL